MRTWVYQLWRMGFLQICRFSIIHIIYLLKGKGKGKGKGKRKREGKREGKRKGKREGKREG